MVKELTQMHVNWTDVNWIINAVTVAFIGVIVRNYFNHVKEKQNKEKNFENWQVKINHDLHDIQELLEPHVRRELVFETNEKTLGT